MGSSRLHGLDALRAVAMMLGVWLHAGLPYISGLPPFYWAIDDPNKSDLIDHSITLIHAWRMEVFFLLSGFFTAMLVVRRGVRGTAWQRVLRIVFPFVLAVLLIQPMCAAIWGYGYSVQWGFPAKTAVTNVLKTSWGIDVPGVPSNLISLWHLWFLYVLIWLIAVGLVMQKAAPPALRRAGHSVGTWLGAVIGSWWGALFLAVPVGSMLLLHGPTGADTNETIVPNWSTLAYYALPFGCGWLIYPARERLASLARLWWVPMGYGLLIAFPLYLYADSLGALGMDATAGPYLLAIGSHALMTTGLGLGMIGLSMRLLASPGPRTERLVRYGSDMAYWVYLAHMPVVVGLGILVLEWQVPALAKMGVVLTGSGIVLIVSYQFLVRHTLVGRLLNGPRARRVGSRPVNPPDSLERGANMGDPVGP
ncbi:MAG: acyltransferase family protein [Planctomycetota bacterium]